jgi:hypothetical protein
VKTPLKYHPLYPLQKDSVPMCCVSFLVAGVQITCPLLWRIIRYSTNH